MSGYDLRDAEQVRGSHARDLSMTFEREEPKALLADIESRLPPAGAVGPSPRDVNDGDGIGGLSRADIDGWLDALEANYLGGSRALAPVTMEAPATA